MIWLPPFRKTPLPAPVPEKKPETVAPAVPDAAALAAAKAEEDMLQAAIAAGDVPTIARVVIEGASTKVRQQAAEAIEDPELIRKLVHDARGGKDKNVYKILARKRDVLLAQERAVEQLQADIAAAAAAIERHSHRHFDALFTPALDQLEERWKVVASQATPEVLRKTEQAIDRGREVIAQHLRQIAAEASRQLAAQNAAVLAQEQREQQEKAVAAATAERERVTAEERSAAAQKHEAQAHALQQIGGLLRKAHGALASGSSKTAAGLRHAIDEKLAASSSLPAHLANQLKQLDAKLQELKDWKNFSVAPKRVELIGRMEALIGATMHPTALAGHIKDLQEQWRTLTKGAAEDIEAEWQHFHKAAQAAFQPCREYYDAQDAIKQNNLRERGVICERLVAFEAKQNWEDPDWLTVIDVLREARQLWRQHAPVDPAAAEALQMKFNAVEAGMQGRVDALYARNVQEKRRLIERASELLALPDNAQAIDEVKRLQEKWKFVRPMPRDADRKLWEEFRKHCDALFEKRQQESAGRTASLESSRAHATSLCEELESIAALADAELPEGAKKLPDLRLAFDAIEELPRGQVRQLSERFERAFERCRAAVAQQQARSVEQGWSTLFDVAEHIRTYRWARLHRAESAELDVLKQAAEAPLASAAGLPKRGVEVLRNALTQSGEGDAAANELALRTLCIRAEILVDRPTPAADQTLRREHQMRRLVASMGQGIKAGADTLDALVLEWLGAAPVEAAAYAELLARFKECRRR